MVKNGNEPLIPWEQAKSEMGLDGNLKSNGQ